LADEERALVADVIQFPAATPFLLFAFVVMDDHAHALVSPQTQKLERVTHRWKSFSAHQLQRKFGRHGVIWQSECFDRIVRNERDFVEKCAYIFNNPFKRWPALETYNWMGPL
jgi:REP element-mobilizing transposase RayT